MTDENLMLLFTTKGNGDGTATFSFTGDAEGLHELACRLIEADIITLEQLRYVLPGGGYDEMFGVLGD